MISQWRADQLFADVEGSALFLHDQFRVFKDFNDFKDFNGFFVPFCAK